MWVSPGHLSPLAWGQVSPGMAWPRQQLQWGFYPSRPGYPTGIWDLRAQRRGGGDDVEAAPSLSVPRGMCPLAGLGVSGKSVGSGPGPSRRNSNSSVRLPVGPGTAFLSRPNSSAGLSERAPVLKQFQCCEELTWDIWEQRDGAPICGRSIPLGCSRAAHAQSNVLLPNPVLEEEGEVMERRTQTSPVREGEGCGMLGIHPPGSHHRAGGGF